MIKCCPEVAGGLPTPRPAAEIQGGSGSGVLNGTINVKTADGSNLSDAFISGAQATLALVQDHSIKLALLKSNSPSCSNQQIYNGCFDGALVEGEGVTTALLRQHGVLVFNEYQLDELEEEL